MNCTISNLLRHRLSLFIMLGVLATTGVAVAADETASTDMKTSEILTKLSTVFDGAKSFRVETSSTAIITGPMSQSMTNSMKISAKRPSKFAAALKSGDGLSLYSDGTTLTLYAVKDNKYQARKAPESLEEATPPGLMEIQAVGPGAPVIVAAFSKSASTSLLEGVTTATYVGREKIDGKDFDRMRFAQTEVDWELWVAADGKPLPRRLRVDMSRGIAAAAEKNAELKGAKADISSDFLNWELDADIPDSEFNFTVPAGATEVPMDGPGDDEQEGPSPLLGKPAPEFSLELLDGTKIDNAKLKGKVVLLDFWATWCGPCRASLPVISGVADSYKSKDVVVYAVNVREGKDAIKTFLEKSKLALTVALDTDGSVSEKYGARGIPHTVIIGKDGTVQVVHTGFSPALKAELSKNLDALVAGKTLATPSSGDAASTATK